ncbi:hypothetical protein HZS_4653, partial [Henneguya salminicola]
CGKILQIYIDVKKYYIAFEKDFDTTNMDSCKKGCKTSDILKLDQQIDAKFDYDCPEKSITENILHIKNIKDFQIDERFIFYLRMVQIKMDIRLKVMNLLPYDPYNMFILLVDFKVKSNEKNMKMFIILTILSQIENTKFHESEDGNIEFFGSSNILMAFKPKFNKFQLLMSANNIKWKSPTIINDKIYKYDRNGNKKCRDANKIAPPQCTKDLNNCDKSKCKNSGSCSLNVKNKTINQQCKCSQKTFGFMCQHISRCTNCKKQFCSNTNHCTDCRKGWSDQNCSVRTCKLSNMCINNGSCKIINGLRTCECISGFVGKFCEINCSRICGTNLCETFKNKIYCDPPYRYSINITIAISIALSCGLIFIVFCILRCKNKFNKIYISKTVNK